MKKIFLLKQNGFSLIEIIFSLLLIGIVFSAVMMTLVHFKKQNLGILHFVHKKSKLIETQLFLNNYFSIAVPNSFIISGDLISWSGYDSLFIATKNADFMDYSIHVEKYELKLINNNLFFNNSLLLKNVKSINFAIQSSKDFKHILVYNICEITINKLQDDCVNDFVILQDSSINKKDI